MSKSSLAISFVAEQQSPADYAASKAALISLSDSLRYELDKRFERFIFSIIAFEFHVFSSNTQIQVPEHSHVRHHRRTYVYAHVLPDEPAIELVPQILHALSPTTCYCESSHRSHRRAAVAHYLPTLLYALRSLHDTTSKLLA